MADARLAWGAPVLSVTPAAELLAAVAFPALPAATRHAMDALKHAVHGGGCCCFHGRPAPLAREVGFFEQRYGPSGALAELIALRSAYRPAYAFVLRCLPAMLMLHVRMVRDNRFPRVARAGDMELHATLQSTAG